MSKQEPLAAGASLIGLACFMRQVLCLNSHMAQERLCSRASFSCMGPPGMQPGLITPRRAAGVSHGVSRGVQQMRVEGDAELGLPVITKPCGQAWRGAPCCLEALTGAYSACVCLGIVTAQLLASSSLRTSVSPVNGGGIADLYRGIQAIKTMRGWEQSSGAQAGSLLVSVSLRGAQGLAFLTTLRLCRRGRESCSLRRR